MEKTTVMREVVGLVSDPTVLKALLQGVEDKILKDIILLALSEQRRRCSPIKVLPGGTVFAPGLAFRK